MKATVQKFGYDIESGLVYDGTYPAVTKQKTISDLISDSISLYQKLYQKKPEESYLFDLFFSIKEKAHRLAAEKNSDFYKILILDLNIVFPMLTNDTLLKLIDRLLDNEMQGKNIDLHEVYMIISVFWLYKNVINTRIQKQIDSMIATTMHQKKSLRYKYMDKLEPIFKEILKEELDLPEPERKGRNSPFSRIFHKKIDPILYSIPELEIRKYNKKGNLESRSSWKIRQYKAMVKLYTTWRKNKTELNDNVKMMKDFFEKTFWKKFDFCKNIIPEYLQNGRAISIEQSKIYIAPIEKYDKFGERWKGETDGSQEVVEREGKVGDTIAGVER